MIQMLITQPQLEQDLRMGLIMVMELILEMELLLILGMEPAL